MSESNAQFARRMRAKRSGITVPEQKRIDFGLVYGASSPKAFASMVLDLFGFNDLHGARRGRRFVFATLQEEEYHGHND